MSKLKESMAILNKEFEVIFSHSNETNEAVKYLKKYFQQSFIWRCIRFLIIFGLFAGVISLMVYYIPTLNWNASAIGRLALIKLILPLYNWKYLYNSRCLIEAYPEKWTQKIDNHENYGEFEDEECTVCESLGKF